MSGWKNHLLRWKTGENQVWRKLEGSILGMLKPQDSTQALMKLRFFMSQVREFSE